MQKNRFFTIVFLFLVWLAVPNQTFPQNDYEVKALAGFDTLKVLVEDLNPETERAGLTKEQIQTDIEIKLRKAGFNVKDKDAFFTPFIFLYIKVITLHRSSGLVAYHIETSLTQEILLERNKSISTLANTWTTGGTGTIGQDNIRDLRNDISDQVDEFINDYLKANTSAQKQSVKPPKNIPSPTPTTKQDDSPFTATYVGGNNPPTVEVFNDTDRTMYFDFGQGKMAAYTIPSGKSQKITIPEGTYNYKASAPRVKSDEGQETFKKGYSYTWRFYIVTVPR